MVGRNRREAAETQLTPLKKRNVIGKKGLGKLSVFGVCTQTVIRTVNQGLENAFSMDLNEIEKLKGEYHPQITSLNSAVSTPDGTELWLKNVKKKGSFDFDGIIKSLSQKFTIFDELKTTIFLNSMNRTVLTNEMKFSALKTEYKQLGISR
jgi:hypothetical protein